MGSSIGIRALQQNASSVVARAAKGEVIEITDRGRPVATLVPGGRGGLDALIKSGVARPPRRRIRDLPPPLRARRSQAALSELLAESRAEER